jgi:hypothetical protein
MESIRKQYFELTESNDHGGATELLVSAYGSEDEQKEIRELNARNNRMGAMIQADLIRLGKLASRYFPLMMKTTI